MAWVTKDSTEQYAPEEPQREYTKQEKRANWWHYHKWHVVIGAAAAAILIWILHDMLGQVKPDYRVGYVGTSNLPVDTVAALQTALAAYCDDRNGDGQVVVEVDEYTIDFNEETDATDAYSQMAGITRLTADLNDTDGPCIYILQDAEYAELFVHRTGALQYLDGSMPNDDDTESDDWTQMVYRWTDCPVLTALDLGSYTGLTLVDDLTGENQDILAGTCVGCRAYTDEQKEKNADYLALWQTLIDGAVTTAGQG